MASAEETVQFICDQIGLGRRVIFRKMFGEYALYLDGKVTALICDDQLFLKPTPEGRAYLGKVREAAPYPGAKKYFLLTEELDDPDRLGEVFQITARALPAPRSQRPASDARTRKKSPRKKA